VSLYVHVTRQRLVKNFTVVANTHQKKEDLLDASFYMQSRMKGEFVDLFVYPCIVVRQRLCKHFSAATKNC
jgi:hypothetical protein